jgi:hypothetical protein
MSIVSDSIAWARENARQIAKKMTEMRPVLNRIIGQMVKKGINPSLTFTSYSADVSFSGTRDDLNTFFKIMRSEGFVPSNRPDEEQTSFSCSWTRGEDECNQRIWASFYSTTCQRVQVGTKMVEQPIYEIRCK